VVVEAGGGHREVLPEVVAGADGGDGRRSSVRRTVPGMTEIADRYRKVADGFQARVEGVAPDGWDAPAPCEGWAARDIVDHIGQTTGFFLSRAELTADIPPAADDPAATWAACRATMERVLDDPEVAGREIESPFGQMKLEDLVGGIGISDLLVHTWDLSRATGQDESIDPDEAQRTLSALQAMGDNIRGSGAFGPEVAVDDGADLTTRLIAYTGRTP
jgi:uncharacterized protein (TIGR03086 family)